MGKQEEKEERCPHCGYCKHCGRSDMSQPFVIKPYYPYPYPTRYPWIWWEDTYIGTTFDSNRVLQK